MFTHLKTYLFIVLTLMACMTSALAQQPENTLVTRALPVDLSGGAPINSAEYIGDWEYSDPTIHVKVEQNRIDECDYWVADIQIGHASQLRTAAADSFSSNMVLPGSAIAQRVNAVVAVNGDFFCYSRKGFIIRQGELYMDRLTGRRDLLLIDEDGDFHFIRKAKKNEGVFEIDGKKVINAFYFGPVLVDNGELNKDYSCDEMAFSDPCQRMCIAQVGPLHYKIVCCAAPYRGSTGMTMRAFAKLVYDLGLKNAYNLDGGDSTMLIFRGEKINDLDNPKTRNIADIVYFASSATSQ